MPRPIENARQATGLEPLSTMESWNEKNLEIAVWRLPGNGALKFAVANNFACIALGAIENQALFDGAGNHLRTGPVAQGRFRLVQGPAQFESRVINSAPIEMLNIYFSTRLMNQIARDLGLRPKQIALKDPMWDQPDDLIETLTRSVAKDIRSPAVADRMFAQETALLILRRLLARHSNLAEMKSLADPKLQGDFRWAVEFMIDNLEKALVVDQLAVLAKMSTFSFTRGFTRIYGKTPTSYLRQLRLDRAKELLLHTSLPIAAVALRVGYSDAAHFVIAFKRDAGVTPRSYRLNQGGELTARPIGRSASA
jgi:AraC family transcriptional regulator